MDFPDLSGIEWPAAIAVALILGGYILRRRWRRQDERMKELQDAKDAYKKAVEDTSGSDDERADRIHIAALRLQDALRKCEA